MSCASDMDSVDQKNRSVFGMLLHNQGLSAVVAERNGSLLARRIE